MEDVLTSSSLIKKAHDFAKKAHRGQRRVDGSPYFEHAYEAARATNDWGMDDATIAAAFLHDVAEDTDITLEEIDREFGNDIAFLVDGVTKLGRIKYRGKEAQIETIRKMVLAMAEDIRVVIIKLADRLHNMHTLSALPPQKRKRIALETDEIYAPIAYRLGMQYVSGQLRDLAFPYLAPKEHEWLSQQLKERYEEREKYLAKVKPHVERLLRENGISEFQIDFRAKRHSSLYKKLLRYNMDIDNIYDLMALRIIVPTINDCYGVLGAIHSLWPPMPGRIKDYIAMPKPNGYRSIHTTVFCLDNRITEFQIRTQQMHDEAEMGIAAHWAYKDNMPVHEMKNSKELAWVRQLRQWQQDFPDSESFIESLKIDFFKDRIFVATPKGEVVDLPAEATPIDFAYKIHTEIGDSCTGARVNGKIVPLDFELKSGDTVEILTQKGKKPSESWLRIAKSSTARSHIKSALRKKGGHLNPAYNARKIVEFRIAADDRIGLLKDVTALFARSKINICDINSDSRASMPIMKIQCEIRNERDIEKMLLKLKRIEEIREISYRYV